jgi:hypothetical protein
VIEDKDTIDEKVQEVLTLAQDMDAKEEWNELQREIKKRAKELQERGFSKEYIDERIAIEYAERELNLKKKIQSKDFNFDNYKYVEDVLNRHIREKINNVMKNQKITQNQKNSIIRRMLARDLRLPIQKKINNVLNKTNFISKRTGF